MLSKNKKYPNMPDISQLAPFYFHITDDKRTLKKTLDYLKKHIWDEEVGGFRRFRKFEVCDNWHWYTGGSGSWCALTIMAVRFYKEIKEKKSYKQCLDWIKDISKLSNNLLPEHIATKEEYNDWKANEIEINSIILNETKKAENNIKKYKGKKIILWANPLGWSHAEYILLKSNK